MAARAAAAAQLLERESALVSLDEALDDVRAGSGRIALVAGEAGIGKTSLVRSFAGERADRARVLWGTCDALFTPRPLGPVHDIAEEVGGPLLDALSSGANRQSLLSTLLNELGAVPSVAVFEDVHWADEATLDALKYLTRRIERTPCLLVLTYRDDEVGLEHPLRVLLGDLSSRLTTRVLLSPLSEHAVAVLAERAERPDAGLHAATGGNPFFVTEVLAARGTGVPATVRDAVLARVVGLPQDARDVLDVASLVPGRIEHWLLDATVASAPDAVTACVERGALVAAADSVSFRHDLARQAVLEALEPRRRATLERKVLEALESRAERDGLLARLAHHAEALDDRGAILEYAPEAATRASTVGAHREAAEHFAHAVRVSGELPPRRRAELLDAYGFELAQVGRLADAVEAREEAVRLWQESGEPRRESESLARTTTVHILLGQDAIAEEKGRRAIEVLRDEPECVELAYAYRGYGGLRMLQRDTEEAITWCERAIELAERFGHAETVISATISMGAAYLCASDVERGAAYLESGLRMAWEADMDALVGAAYVNLGSAAGEVYELELARRVLEEGIAYAKARDLDYGRDYQLAWLALTLVYTGFWDEAGEMARDVLTREAGGAISRIMSLLALGRLRTRRGDPGAREVLDEALALSEHTGTLQRLGPVRAARAEAAWLSGDAERAAEEARAAYGLALGKRHAWFAGELAYWQWKTGALESAPEYAAEPFALEISGRELEAAEAWRARGCPYEAARALAASGEEDALREALTAFEQLGAGPSAAAARRSLRDLGVRAVPRGPRPQTRENPAQLTARELDVLRLVAEGLRNAEIAERLFVSRRTVDHHVSAILRKLGAATRGEAVAAARQLEILHDA